MRPPALLNQLADDAALGAASRQSCSKALLGIFRDALVEIAGSHYQKYGHTGHGLYGIGVSDGHRYCAAIASKALEQETPNARPHALPNNTTPCSQRRGKSC